MEAGDWVKCIKPCGSGGLPMKIGDIVQVRNVGPNYLDLTRNGKESCGSDIKNFVLASLDEIPYFTSQST